MTRTFSLHSKDFKLTAEQHKALRKYLAHTRFNMGRKQRGKVSVENLVRFYLYEVIS